MLEAGAFVLPQMQEEEIKMLENVSSSRGQPRDLYPAGLCQRSAA
jgi:hypothetical protein